MTKHQKEKFWELINQYTICCGGNPSEHIYGNINRQNIVIKIEQLIEEMSRQS